MDRSISAKECDGIESDHCASIGNKRGWKMAERREAYDKTWDLFFRWHRPSDPFDVLEIGITAGQDVGFAVALMRCGGTNGEGQHAELVFRLTIGLRKIDERWRIVHEHHSVPSSAVVSG